MQLVDWVVRVKIVMTKRSIFSANFTVTLLREYLMTSGYRDNVSTGLLQVCLAFNEFLTESFIQSSDF